MRILHTSFALGFLTLLGFAGCTITTGVDGDGFGGDDWGTAGEGGAAGEGGSASTDGGTASTDGGTSSTSGGSSAEGGSTAALYTADMCADSASANSDDECLSCAYTNQCDPAVVECENESGCMATVTAVLSCLRNVAAYNAVAIGDTPSTGAPTPDDVDNCMGGVYTAADLDNAYLGWDEYAADGLSTSASDWVGAEVTTDTETSLINALADTGEFGCQAVCHLDER